MKTTVEIPDELYRRAKAEAALRGKKLRDLVHEGLQAVLDRSRVPRSRLTALLNEACGSIDSGVSDLGSNPRHLKGFGRRDRGHR